MEDAAASCGSRVSKKGTSQAPRRGGKNVQEQKAGSEGSRYSLGQLTLQKRLPRDSKPPGKFKYWAHFLTPWESSPHSVEYPGQC